MKATKVRVGSLVGVGGFVLLVASGSVARSGTVGPAERTAFHAINGLPNWLQTPLWLFQQLGNIVVALVVLVAIACLMRNWRLAVSAAVAMGAKLRMEDVVKTVVERRRPGSSIAEAVLRGDVSVDGLSFVSGHAVVATAGAMMLTGVLPRRWRALPWIACALNGVGRVYSGAHSPLDIVGGVGLGLVIGAPLYIWLAKEPGSDDWRASQPRYRQIPASDEGVEGSDAPRGPIVDRPIGPVAPW